MATVYRVEDKTGRGPYRAPSAACDIMMADPDEVKGMSRREANDFLNDRQMGGGTDGITDCWVDDLPPGWGERPIGDAIKWKGHSHFGFASPERLCHWMLPSQRKKLAKIGFRVGVYEVPDDAIHYGGHQVFYNTVHAKLLRTEPLDTFSETEVAA
jgi:hypothetical protein